MSGSECLVLEGGPLLLLKATEVSVGSWVSHPGLGSQRQVGLCDFEITLVSIAPGQPRPQSEILGFLVWFGFVLCFSRQDFSV